MLKFLIIFLAFAIVIKGRFLKEDPKADLELTILHVNDIHAHFEPSNIRTGRCSPELAAEKKCYGGQARLLTKIREIRDKDPGHTLLMNAGDYYTGSAIFHRHGYEAVVDFSNLMGYDVVSLGNHDFDLGIEGVQHFIDGANYPVLATNLDLREETMLKNCSKSWTKDIDGHRIGVIGYVTSETPAITSGSVETILFYQEIEAIRNEAQWLKEKKNCDIIIALGHSGYEVDIEIARAVPTVDLVIGGHSHTFLWTGDDPPQHPDGPYPTYIEQPESGKVVPVVQAYAYSMYLGHFTARFDKAGNLMIPVDGEGIQNANPILITFDITEDKNVKDVINNYRKDMEEFDLEIGETKVLLISNGMKESNIGNMMADSYVEGWNCTVDLSLVNNGGIRSAIVPGVVNVEDIWNVAPFQNTIKKAEILGKDLKMILEKTYSPLCPEQNCHAESFLQMSNLKVKIEVQKSNQGQRVKELKIRCKTNPTGAANGRCLEALEDEWCDVEDDKHYKLAISSFLAGSKKFKSCLKNVEDGELDSTYIQRYIERYTPLNTTIEDRITIDYIMASSRASFKTLSLFLVVKALIMCCFSCG